MEGEERRVGRGRGCEEGRREGLGWRGPDLGCQPGAHGAGRGRLVLDGAERRVRAGARHSTTVAAAAHAEGARTWARVWGSPQRFAGSVK